MVVKAQCRVGAFARRYGWGHLVQEPFMYRVEIYDNKDELDNRIRLLFFGPLPVKLPITYSAGLENCVLFCVSPELYQQNYPQGWEPEAIVKLMAHEIIHRLHVRILDGDEDAMGPVWFFEGFAIYGSGQFEGMLPRLSPERINEIIHSTNRGNYLEYATVFRHLLKTAPMKELIEKHTKKAYSFS